MLSRHLSLIQDCKPQEGLEAHHTVDVLTLVGQIIQLRIIERCTVSYLVYTIIVLDFEAEAGLICPT